MKRRYLDATTLVQRYGKPDIFLTMTYNPSWPEIKAELNPIEEAQNRPDLIARIFHAKIAELKVEIIEKELFGPVIAYTYVIEYQKRGLPHIHFLIILKRHAKILNPDEYDKYIFAEIPDKNVNPHLYNAVVKHMMHGPCGILNPHNVCMNKKHECKNKCPREFSEVTKSGENSYPIYRRRNSGIVVNVRGSLLDNRWVVPYNPYLLAKFDCHINVEICSTIKAVKYLYKYIYKGHDRVAFQLVANESETLVDEITTFRNGRWISPSEAAWRIFKFRLNDISPSVIALQLKYKLLKS